MEIEHDEKRQRFEVEIDGQRSELDYVIERGEMIFTHTGVPPALEGRGIASALAKAGLDFARNSDLKVVPACSFIRVYIKRHPEYGNLLA